MEINWVVIKDNEDELRKNIIYEAKYSLALLTCLMGKTPTEIKIPKVYLANLEDRMRNKEEGFVPCIAEHKDGEIWFCKEILTGVIENLDYSPILIRYLMVHEMLHHILEHKSDTKEERDRAEEEVTEWFYHNLPKVLYVFSAAKETVERIEYEHRKMN